MEFTHNQPEYSVAEIAGHIKRVVEETFGHVRVRGEISKVSINTVSGHGYLTLKDDKAVLDAVCWKGTLARLAHKPEAGMEVIATGRLTTYPGNSKYQLVIESLEPAGIGALMAMLEKRKAALAAEGLFAPERKRPIPFLPEVIGVITSPTGAVIRDILHRIADRFPTRVILWPVAVQGKGAAEQIAAAIDGFAEVAPRPDLLIVARGGGSIEDLWAFNEEILVRAAAASTIPIISAVGHETDTTLIDYAADKRAPTPTAAAEMAVPVRVDLSIMIDDFGLRMREHLYRRLQIQEEKILGLARALPGFTTMIDLATQRLDELSNRLRMALPARLERAEQKLGLLMAALTPQRLLRALDHQQHQLQLVSAKLKPLVERRLEQCQSKLAVMAASLPHLDVTQILKRGFAVVRGVDGRIIPSMSALPAQGEVTLQFADGTRAATLGKLGAAKQGKFFDN
jgi:exodeoxyribonuclease VII large subunit